MEIQAAIHHYCNYSERCHKDVRNKLYELGCTTPEVEQHIATLIEEGLLNEERYARAFARGKFRMLQWGKVKIINQLKAHGISAYCIKKALKEIDDDAYSATMQKLAVTKTLSLKAVKSKTAKKAKLYAYLLQKGYERDIVIDLVNKLINT
ncbi:MAG: regulatory protein RecX [Flavipsychrobacter sp.]|nr:regulatory protein RecX [Flavipsychrobacter sp.]